MLRLAFSTLAGRKAGAAGAFVAVALAAVLAGSMGILLQSSLQAPLAVERLKQATVVVQGPTSTTGVGNGTYAAPLLERATIDPSVASRLQGVPGVARVVTDRSVYATLLDAHGRVYYGSGGEPTGGHGWESSQLTPYAVVAGHAPRGVHDVVVDRKAASSLHLHVGDRVRVLTIAGSTPFVVSGIAATPHGTKLPSPGALFFRSDVAAQLSSDPGRVDLVAVVARPGVSAHDLAAAVTVKLGHSHLRVLTGAKRGDAESPDGAVAREDVVAALTVFSVIAAFVALFVVSSTFALSVQQRHRELALFRAIGSTPRQVRRLVAGEALLIALAAVLVALPLGVVAAYLERGLFARAGMIPAGLHLVIGWLPMAAALVSAVVTTQFAAFASARRAARIRPADALRESAGQGSRLSRVRVLVGLLALGGGIATLVAAANGSGLLESEAPGAGLALTLGVVLLGPVLAWPFAFVGGWPPAATGSAQGLLAWANSRANLRRVASVATPVMLAVSVAGTMYVAKSVLRQETHNQTELRTTAAYVLQAHGATGLPAAIEADAAGLDGVNGVTGTIATTVVAGGRDELISAQARAIDPGSSLAGLDLDLAAGSLRDVRGDGVAVSVQSARDWRWSLGERVRFTLGDGSPVSARVVAEYRRPLGFGEMLLPRPLVAGHVTRALDDAVFVAAGGARVAGELESLRASYPTLDVVTRNAYVVEVDAAGQKQALEVYVLLALIVVFCALGLVNALTMAVSARRGEFATLLLIGATRRQVRAMVRIETMITLAFGLVAGSAVAVPGLALLEHSLDGSWMPAVPVWAAFGLLGSYAALGMAATVVPLRSALRAASAGSDR